MGFEYDPAKSEANAAKHGLDFCSAEKLWADPDALAVTGRSESELRQILLGRLDGKLWAAVFTVRGENVRIISVRRARTDEEALYDQAEQNDG